MKRYLCNPYRVYGHLRLRDFRKCFVLTSTSAGGWIRSRFLRGRFQPLVEVKIISNLLFKISVWKWRGFPHNFWWIQLQGYDCFVWFSWMSWLNLTSCCAKCSCRSREGRPSVIVRSRATGDFREVNQVRLKKSALFRFCDVKLKFWNDCLFHCTSCGCFWLFQIEDMEDYAEIDYALLDEARDTMSPGVPEPGGPSLQVHLYTWTHRNYTVTSLSTMKIRDVFGPDGVVGFECATGAVESNCPSGSTKTCRIFSKISLSKLTRLSVFSNQWEAVMFLIEYLWMESSD